MVDGTPQEIAGTTSVPDQSEQDERNVVFARRTFRILAAAAIFVLLVAIALNWWFVRGLGTALPSAPVAGSDIPDPATVSIEKPALQMIPDRILQYEPLAHQAIPGYGDHGAEAIFRTLDMNLEAQIGIVHYIRVEAFASSAEAETRRQELMSTYARERSQRQVGAQIAETGFSEDKKAYAQSWVSGQYVTFVKASFDDWIPAVEKDLTVEPGDKIADAVEVYQRTGKQGITQ